MTEDATIRIDCDSAEFVHVTHIMEFFLRPVPTEPVPQDPWNQSRRSELDFSNETGIPRVPLTVSPTCIASHALGSPVSFRH